MIDQNEFERIQEGIKPDAEGIDFLLDIVMDFLTQVDPQKINLYESEFTKRKDSYFIKLISAENRCCPIYIELLNQNEIDIQLNHGGEYLYLQTIQNNADVFKLRNALNDLFNYKIVEEVVKIKGVIKKASYTIRQTINGESKPYFYNLILGHGMPWQKKEKVEIIYEPWIELLDQPLN